jgi:hypothetical protein
MIHPVTGSANTVPMASPLLKSATARERRSGGTHRPNMLKEPGNTAASPMPSAMRAAISAGSDSCAATGVRRVNSDHQRTAAPSTRRPP